MMKEIAILCILSGSTCEFIRKLRRVFYLHVENMWNFCNRLKELFIWMKTLCESRNKVWALNCCLFRVFISCADVSLSLSLTSRLWTRRLSVPQTGSLGEDVDEDVLAESQRVDSGAAGSDLLQVSQLTKVYGHLNRRVQAVNKLSFGIPAGEVSPAFRRFLLSLCYNVKR